MKGKLVKRFVCSFWPFLVFVLLYIVANALLYHYFGSAYQITQNSQGHIVCVPSENDALVFVSSWFSFAEEIYLPVYAGISVNHALALSVLTLNFVVPASALALVGGTHFNSPRRQTRRYSNYFSPSSTYIASIISTLDFTGWTWVRYHCPSSGISIIGFSLLVVYGIEVALNGCKLIKADLLTGALLIAIAIFIWYADYLLYLTGTATISATSHLSGGFMTTTIVVGWFLIKKYRRSPKSV